MKNRILRIGIIIGIIAVIFIANRGLEKFLRPDTVRAFGDLLVDFGVPPGTPLFNYPNLAPGDEKNKNVVTTNSGIVSRFVAVKGVRKDITPTPIPPRLELILDIVIRDGSTPLYGNGSPTGSKNLQNFFSESATPSGVMLNIINPGGQKTYNFDVTFPTSAGNPFQDKTVIFDLTFGVITGENIVINEVYYKVDSNHGLDSPKDGRTGNGKKLGINDEWVELYNPTDHDISLKNWTLTDNSGNPTIIHANKIIKAGGFALVSHSASPWRFWDENRDAIKIETGKQIGDGLDNAGDYLILKNSQGAELDRMSWGTDTSGFTPPGTNPAVPTGHSTERLVPGFDTDAASDWLDRNPPTPGN